MNVSAYSYWFDAVQGACAPQQLGEFSDAEIAARQTPASGMDLGQRLGRLLGAMRPGRAVMPTALHQA